MGNTTLVPGIWGISRSVGHQHRWDGRWYGQSCESSHSSSKSDISPSSRTTLETHEGSPINWKMRTETLPWWCCPWIQLYCFLASPGRDESDVKRPWQRHENHMIMTLQCQKIAWRYENDITKTMKPTWIWHEIAWRDMRRYENTWRRHEKWHENVMKIARKTWKWH